MRGERVLRVLRQAAGRGQLQVGLEGLARLVGLALALQRVAQVHVGDRARRVDLQRRLEVLDGVGVVVDLPVDEAEVVGGQREVGLQLQRLREQVARRGVVLLLEELHAAVVELARLLLVADRRGRRRGDLLVLALQVLHHHAVGGGAGRDDRGRLFQLGVQRDRVGRRAAAWRR